MSVLGGGGCPYRHVESQSIVVHVVLVVYCMLISRPAQHEKMVAARSRCWCKRDLGLRKARLLLIVRVKKPRQVSSNITENDAVILIQKLHRGGKSVYCSLFL
jgi:hypothetical protein